MTGSLPPRDFSVALGKWAKGMLPEKQNRFVRTVGLKALRGVVMMTPVGNPDLWTRPAPPGYVGGRARANWQVTTGSPGGGILENVDPSGNGTIRNGTAAMTVVWQEPFFGRITLFNNLPYIEALEHGHSTQAANGMVAVTLANIRAELA